MSSIEGPSVPGQPIAVTDDPTTCRILIDEMVKAIRASQPSREKSLVITKLQEAAMWLEEVLRLS